MLDVNMINDAITKKAQLDAEAERLAMDKELAARKALKAEIKKMAPRIKATIDVCNMLIDNGFTLRRYDSSYGKNNRSNGGFYHAWRNTPCFSYGDISHTLFPRMQRTVGGAPLSVIKQYIENQKNV